MKRLYVLYDAECELCRRLRLWLARRASYVPLVFIPFQSPDLDTRFPGVTDLHPEQRLIVIADTGELWRGSSAWITVLWALREYREWAQRLAHPALQPFAQRACNLVSENRYSLSRWLMKAGVSELHRELAAAPEPTCRTGRGSCGYQAPRPSVHDLRAVRPRGVRDPEE